MHWQLSLEQGFSALSLISWVLIFSQRVWVHISTRTMCTPLEARRRCQLIWNAVIDDCDSPCGCWKLVSSFKWVDVSHFSSLSPNSFLYSFIDGHSASFWVLRIGPRTPCIQVTCSNPEPSAHSSSTIILNVRTILRVFKRIISGQKSCKSQFLSKVGRQQKDKKPCLPNSGQLATWQGRRPLKKVKRPEVLGNKALASTRKQTTAQKQVTPFPVRDPTEPHGSL